jgi:UDP-glucuronate decarboxylase
MSEEFKLVSPSRNELDLLQGTTELDLLVGEEEVDCIVHLANPRVYTSNIALGDTLTMLRNVLDVCIERDIRLIYLSSFEVYSGYRSSFLIADESLPLLPKGPYGETKYLCEMMIEYSRLTQGLRCAILRSSPIYGPNNGRPKFIYNFIDKLERSQPVVTHLYNNGLPSLDLLYIDDFVAAFLNIVKSNFNGNLNIGTGMTTPIREVAEVLRNLLGGNSKIDEALIDSDTAGIAMDARKALETFGWQPTINIEQGFRLVLANLKNEGIG